MQVKRLIFVCERRVVGILNESSCVLSVQFGIDIGFDPIGVEVFDLPVLSSEIDHRSRAIVLGLHIQTRYTCRISHFLIISTERRRDMHDTRTIFGRDIVTRDHTEGTFARIDPREKRFILHADQVRSFITSDDLCILEVSTQSGFREDDRIFAYFHFHIVDLRSYAEGGVGRQSPRRSGPRNEIAVSCTFDLKARGTGQIFDVAVTTGLVQLMTRESRSGSR